MKPKRLKLDNALIFYDFEEASIRWEGLYTWALDFFNKHQQQPKRMALTAEGLKDSSKTMSFKHYDKKIREIQFKGITDLWFGGGYPDNYQFDSCDCYLSLGISKHRLSKHCFFQMEDDVLPYDAALLQNITRQMVPFFKPKLGFALQLDRYHKDPYSYALSVLNTNETEEEKAECLNWNRAYRNPFDDCGTYKTGDMRDVYALNFITDAVLARQVRGSFLRQIRGQTLRQWIEADSRRGTVSSFTEDLYLWEVPQENVPLVREALKASDILVCFRPYH